MRISHRYRFVFFANPKTASESVRALLDPFSDVAGVNFPQTTPAFPFYSHMCPIEAREAFERFGWPFEAYYRFTFVRNPWARLASLYRMIKAGNPAFPLSFADWLRASRPGGVGGGGDDRARWLKYGTYSLKAFAGDESGNLLVDDVFRMEDIERLPDALRRRGLPLPADLRLPHVNVSRGDLDLKRLYSPELTALVAERYAEDIERFGYVFPVAAQPLPNS